MSSPGIGLENKQDAESETDSGMRGMGRDPLFIEIWSPRGSQQAQSQGNHTESSRNGLSEGPWWGKGSVLSENQMRVLAEQENCELEAEWIGFPISYVPKELGLSMVSCSASSV